MKRGTVDIDTIDNMPQRARKVENKGGNKNQTSQKITSVTRQHATKPIRPPKRTFCTNANATPEYFDIT